MTAETFPEYIKRLASQPKYEKPAEAPHEAYWLQYIKGRIKKNRNFVSAIVGPTGSGKSWDGLSLCEQLDPTFCKERIVTSSLQLLELVNNGNLKPGSCILYDEFGIQGGGKRQWQSVDNKVLNYLFQTFRHKCFILFFTLPYFDFIDSQAQLLFHSRIHCLRIDYNAETSLVKPYLLWYNSKTRNMCPKFLTYRKGRAKVKLKLWNIKKPSEKLIKEYEVIKNAFTKRLNLELQEELTPKTKKSNVIITEKQKMAHDLMEIHKDIAKVAEIMGISVKAIYFHLANYTKNTLKTANGGQK